MFASKTIEYYVLKSRKQKHINFIKKFTKSTNPEIYLYEHHFENRLSFSKPIDKILKHFNSFKHSKHHIEVNHVKIIFDKEGVHITNNNVKITLEYIDKDFTIGKAFRFVSTNNATLFVNHKEIFHNPYSSYNPEYPIKFIRPNILNSLAPKTLYLNNNFVK